MRIWILVLALVGFCTVAANAAQGQAGYLDPIRPAIGSLTAACSGGTCPSTGAVATILATGTSYCAAAVNGTFSGTLTFEQSIDGSNWFGAYLVANSGGSAVNTTTGSFFGTYATQGAINFRVRMSSYSSGTAVVGVYCSPVSQP